MFSLRRARLANNEPRIRPAPILQNICLYFHDASQYLYSILNIESQGRGLYRSPTAVTTHAFTSQFLNNKKDDFQFIPSLQRSQINLKKNSSSQTYVCLLQPSQWSRADLLRISQLFVRLSDVTTQKWPYTQKHECEHSLMIMPICKTLFLNFLQSLTYGLLSSLNDVLYIWMPLKWLRTATLQLCLCSPYWIQVVLFEYWAVFIWLFY